MQLDARLRCRSFINNAALRAVEEAITNAERVLVQDHIDHRLYEAVAQGGRSAEAAMAKIEAITKYL
jgi:DNA-binding FrmR family transcriptional regulator